uniref:protein-histidine N-methyltransferase n=1 Tax=Xiphophorus couchianus TaxID=32473 RepID=A0A3B5LY04_9TELE
MSFCFNFDISGQANASQEVDGNEVQSGNKDDGAKYVSNVSGPVKEAKEHLPPSDPQFLLTDGVFETITIGTLPPLHFLNETVFERTASEREDREKILSFREEKNSDLISGVYEGGLKVWECTYDILEIMEKEGETFSGKTVLDLGCGAGLLGILALKRGARQILFQDYNSTVIEQLTVPNVILNCEEDDEDLNSGSPPPKKRAADLSNVLEMY